MAIKTGALTEVVEQMDEKLDDARDGVDALQKELARMNNHRFIRMYNAMPLLISINFIKGLAFGLGTVVGATILVSAIGFTLSKIDFIPIVGDWAAQIATEMEAGK